MQHVKDGLHVLHVGSGVLPPRVDSRLNINNCLRLNLLRREMSRMKMASPDVVWCYDYRGERFLRHYGSRAVCIYFCNDWFGEWNHYPAKHEKRTASTAHYVISVSPRLCSRFRELNENSHFVPHGLWLPEVAPVYKPKPSPELLGYVGTLNNTIDVGFLQTLLEKTGLQLLLAGPIIEASPSKITELKALISHPRVNYLGDLGTREAEEARSLPDVLLLPYVKGSVRDWGFPIKYFEYIGAGKPIVCTDCMEWPESYRDTVHIYREDQDIRNSIADAHHDWTEERFNHAMELARESSWERRVSTIGELIDVDL